MECGEREEKGREKRRRTEEKGREKRRREEKKIVASTAVNRLCLYLL